MSVYKACDIRGDATEELTPACFRTWGRALARLERPRSQFVVGADVRTTSDAFRIALIEGLVEAGMRVFDLGTVPTPMVQFACRHLGAAAWATVTASHSPINVNGLKWSLAGQPPDERQVGALRAAHETGLHGDRADGGDGELAVGEVDVAYRTSLAGQFAKVDKQPTVRIVVDPGNGCWAGRCGPILDGLFPASPIHLIHDRPDGTFPERGPDCAKPEYLDELSAAVIARGADLGIAFDGDGDRVAFVDEGGVPLTGEQSTWILLQSLGEELPGEDVVYDVKMSDVIAAAARELGARPCVERSGHAFIRSRMNALSARFGAELSGHYFHREDDGLFTACRMINFLAAGASSLGDMRRRCPEIFTTPDLRLPVRSADQDEVVALVRNSFDDHPQRLVDGVRIDFENGWGLVRKSVTEQALTFRFEGADRAALEEVVEEFSARLGDHGRALRRQYEETGRK